MSVKYESIAVDVSDFFIMLVAQCAVIVLITDKIVLEIVNGSTHNADKYSIAKREMRFDNFQVVWTMLQVRQRNQNIADELMYAFEITDEFRAIAEMLDSEYFKQVFLRFYVLQQNPRPPDAQMLEVNTCRVRVGPYRISYEIDEARRRVRVFLLEEVGEGE